MRVKYGFAEINIGGEVYTLAPSLLNISKIGTPKEIIESFHIISNYDVNYITSFSTACNILQCCGLPFFVTGGLRFSELKNKTLIYPGLLPIDDVFILAAHCLKHGVCGIVDDNKEDDKEEKKPKPMTEFDAHKFIVDAMDILSLSLSEAENLTMTQFGKLINAKLSSIKSRDEKEVNNSPEEKEDLEAALYWHEQRVAKINEKNKLLKEAK